MFFLTASASKSSPFWNFTFGMQVDHPPVEGLVGDPGVGQPRLGALVRPDGGQRLEHRRPDHAAGVGPLDLAGFHPLVSAATATTRLPPSTAAPSLLASWPPVSPVAWLLPDFPQELTNRASAATTATKTIQPRTGRCDAMVLPAGKCSSARAEDHLVIKWIKLESELRRSRDSLGGTLAGPARLGTLRRCDRQGRAGRSRDATDAPREMDGHDRLLLEALELRSRTASPFDQARTALALGVWLRASGRPALAQAHLHDALAVFQRFGAAAWADRARGELVRTGDLSVLAHPWWEVLTAQEVQVALVVAQGATNKAAAAELYVSPKTIEYHLSRVYRRVGVHSRSELARLVARTGPPDARVRGRSPVERAHDPGSLDPAGDRRWVGGARLGRSTTARVSMCWRARGGSGNR